MGESTPNDGPLSLAENTSCSVTLEGRQLILARHGGRYYLYNNRCPHARQSLDPMGGSISSAGGDLLRCQRHGAEFLTRSGECVSGPCQGETLEPVPFTMAGQDIHLEEDDRAP